MIKPNVHTKVTGQERVERIKKIAEESKGSYVSVGVHEDAGQYEDGTSVVDVALWNEFGTENMPSRSFVRSAIDDNAEKIGRWREEMLGKMINEGWSLEKVLTAMGFRIQVLVQNKIKSNIPPPNAESTLAAKAKDGVGSNTLIWSGLMLRSVAFKVIMND